MACFIQNHQQTVNGIPVVAPAEGAECDCGTLLAHYDTGTKQLYWYYTPTGRLVGR